MTTLHSALFIDYDNVRTELDRYDPAIAARFSNKTLVWLDALEKQLALPEGLEADGRRIVSRRCYASPQRIGNHRRNFTQTGFEVIDCPPLTSHLKNSADIYIVMDIVDYLQRYPHIDEFIILSADADFVPVLNRLRKELKKSVIFTSYNTTSAYRNCSDRTIEPDFFAKHLAVETVAPRVAVEAAAPAASAPPAKKPAPRKTTPAEPGEALEAGLASDIQASLKRAADRRYGRIKFAAAAPMLREDLGGQLGDGWAGHRTFTALLEHVEFSGLEIDWSAQEIVDPGFEADLTAWDEAARERLQEIASDVLWTCEKPVPLLTPPGYALLFGELAAHYQSEDPGTFSQAIDAVAEACRAGGVDVGAQEVRFVATGISMQGYRFVDAVQARHLASLWREQVFDLCRQPDWMREPEKAALLAAWFRASDETEAEAMEDFLARTADERNEVAPEPA